MAVISKYYSDQLTYAHTRKKKTFCILTVECKPFIDIDVLGKLNDRFEIALYEHVRHIGVA